MEKAERYLARWEGAGLLDEQTAAAIRSYEQMQERPAGRQWQVLVALILGSILLGAGVLLFVAAHWDAISPVARMVLVLLMLSFFHSAGLAARERFAGFATAMHAVGTIAAGAAIALVGQIFNMQEHWPAAVMLWAMCAGAGWYLLRDQIQQTLTLLLLPAWVACEWAVRTQGYAGSGVYLARAGVVMGVLYLVAWLQTRRSGLFAILFAFGAVVLPICVGILANGWVAGNGYFQQWGFLPGPYRIAGAGLILVVIAAGWFVERRSLVPALVAAALAFALPWAQTTAVGNNAGQPWIHSEPSVLAYAMVAGAAIFLVWWGVRIVAKSLVNYGMVAFAMTVMWFYFSSVMDKLGRSLGLIVLGVLFLAGGYALERTRRSLVAGMAGGVA